MAWNLYSRKIVSWAMAPDMPAALVCKPLQLAIAQRNPSPGLSKKEIHRCLKPYIVRELYPLILADLHDSIRPA